MSLIEAFIFGFLQGITEFLPVSSSAHLKLAKLFFGVEGSEGQVVFDLVCHLGTLAAVIYYLKKEIIEVIHHQRYKLVLLFIALLPLIPGYFLLKPVRDFASQPSLLGICLMITGTILFIGNKVRIPRSLPTTLKREIGDVLWIGAMQSTALIPGISRSASTISCAKALGWTAKEAVRFSFLLSIPTIIGGNCLELLKISLAHEKLPHISPTVYATGFLTSLLIGCIAVRFAIQVLEKGNLKPFAWYCFGLGATVTIYLNFI